MIVTENTMLIQSEDGSLYYKEGDELVPASNTDIQKHYKTMQYNLNITQGCYATEYSDKIIEMIGLEKFEELFFKLEYIQIPENCRRIK